MRVRHLPQHRPPRHVAEVPAIGAKPRVVTEYIEKFAFYTMYPLDFLMSLIEEYDNITDVQGCPGAQYDQLIILKRRIHAVAHHPP